ncbi:response regulator [Lacticaseibacillus absianus]|uniref:response regulator n=1 Tax=Lacticaseibacillus absianus TaxID=2729623 RepID=UPI0015C6E1CF|nr:response regulator [Lacticaseibacillus absianus]
MRKVMIVDDEYMLLRGLRKLIDWTSLGLRVENTEQNPVRALAYLRTNPIDILVSDMNMPEMPGPTFVAAAKQIQPEMELIVVSGYADFDYVKAGLQQHAVNYLSKPIDADELDEAVRAAIDRLEARQQVDANASLAAQTQLRTLVTTGAVELAKSLGVSFDHEQAPVRLLAELNPLPPNILTAYLDAVPGVRGFFREAQDFVILFQGDQQHLSTFINESPRAVASAQRPVLVGPEVSKVDQLPGSYAQLTAEIARQYFFETASGLRVMLAAGEADNVPTLPDFSSVRQQIAMLEPAAFKRWLAGQFEGLREANASVLLTRQMALLVLMVLAEKLTRFEDKAEVIATINQAPVVTKLSEILVAVAQRAATHGTRRYSRNVAAVQHIIHERYAEPLTLSNVAAELHLNSVYLGQLFKQETGRTFAQYRNDWRIGVAIDMLRNINYDINEIALAVGYPNPNYFYKIFKLQTSMSPREYREAMGR